MANVKAPKPLSPPSTPIERALVDASKQVTPEQAATALAKKRKELQIKLRTKAITTGALSYIPVLFYYANGEQQWISMPKDNAKKFGIVDAPEGTLTATGKGITKVKTKTIKVSYGFKIVKRKKAVGGRVAGRGGSLVATQVRAFISVSVPADAALIDIIAFARTFPKVPGLVRYNQQDFILNYKRAIGGAGAAK